MAKIDVSEFVFKIGFKKSDTYSFFGKEYKLVIKLKAYYEKDGITNEQLEAYEYYVENKVRYISINDGRGYAIVEGSEAYEVEFEYHKGEISSLVCSCFCSYNCKHEFATMLQLRESLEFIEKNYAEEYERTGYFATVSKPTLFTFAVDTKETGSFVL